MLAGKKLDGSGQPGSGPGANLRSISNGCYFREVAFESEVTQEISYLPLGCLQGDVGFEVWGVRHLEAFGGVHLQEAFHERERLLDGYACKKED